jgi:Flp pilus assembly protein TadD
MNPQVARAQMLMQQNRYELAEAELRRAVVESPDEAGPHRMLGLCLSKLGREAEALAECRVAVRCGPDSPRSHYVLALVLHQGDREAEAMAAIEEAIRLDPHDADSWGVAAAIHVAKERWPAALEAAERGLELDAESGDCVNFRAIALTKLGRREEAGRTIDAALAQNPQDAWAHANMGWTLLHGGKQAKAAEHFREALRLEPEMEWARAGIVEALKARNVVYRWLLRYMLWATRMPAKQRLYLSIGIVVALQIGLWVPTSEAGQAAGLVVALVYLAFVTTVATAVPLFNLLLMADRFGRLTLSRDQRRDAYWIGLAVLIVGGMIAANISLAIRRWDAVAYMILLTAAGVAIGVPRKARRTAASWLAIGLFAVALVYWYRWITFDWVTFDQVAGANIATSAGRAVLGANTDFVLHWRDLHQSQEQLNDVFIWGAIAMTWLSPVFHRRKPPRGADR